MPLWIYHIDYPSAEHGSPQDKTGWIVQGWVLIEPKAYAELRSEQRPYLSLRLNDNLVRYVPLDRVRPDVVDSLSMNKDKRNYQPQLQCGFRLSMPLVGVRLPMYLHFGEHQYLLTEIDLPVQAKIQSDLSKPLLKVLQGKDNWLFLDNDTNFSVDQHRGYLGLSKSCVIQWQHYTQGWQTQLQSFGPRAIFLVAPTKESVLTQYYPYEAAKHNLLNTIFDLMPAEMYLYPVSQLRALGDESYYKTDTHWTQQGACLASRLVAQRLGLEKKLVDSIFEQDQYQTKQYAGDLGKKLEPKAMYLEAFLIGFSYRNWVVFDNGLPNFGRVMLIEYEEALKDATCLIFGSSSSYSMFSYLCRVFKRIVFVHTAGQTDPLLLQTIDPDYVIAQTNARFMVKPPRVDYNALAQAKEKSQRLSVEQKKKVVVINRSDKQALIRQLGLDQYIFVI